ncbi:MAG: V-type ATP synthase subunit F [Candidatus Thermoplasmatota archaeon]
MKLAALCDRDTAVGLRLGGIHEIFIVDGNPQNVFDQIRARNDLGVLFITESIVEQLGKPLKEFRLRHQLPLIVEIPDKKGHIEDHIDYVSYLIKKAVGIDIGKKEK